MVQGGICFKPDQEAKRLTLNNLQFMIRILVCLVFLCSFFSCSTDSDPAPEQNNQQQQNNDNNDQGNTEDDVPVRKVLTKRTCDRCYNDERVEHSYSYNDDNEVIEMNSTVGWRLVYVHDEDRIVRMDWYSSVTGNQNENNTNHYEYDELGRLSLLRTGLAPLEVYFVYTYDELDRLIRMDRFNGIENLNAGVISFSWVFTYNDQTKNVYERKDYDKGVTYFGTLRWEYGPENKLFLGEAAEHLDHPRPYTYLMTAVYTDNLPVRMYSYSDNNPTPRIVEEHTYIFDSDGFPTSHTTDHYRQGVYDYQELNEYEYRTISN